MQSAPSRKPNYSLPDMMDITMEQFNEVYPDWILWRATDRKFLPTELRKQPRELMERLLYLDMLADKITGQVMEQMKEDS